MKNGPIRVGFDLDGVILYNPIRVFRPIAAALKPFVFRKKDTEKFYFPKTFIEKWVWRMLHKTSFRPASGLADIEKLAKDKKIEAYLITGRYSFLAEDFKKWLKDLQAERIFKACYYNKNNEQPNAFKEKMIKELHLDVFVEDNWGVLERLNKKNNTKIFWVTNFLDRHKNYPYKFSNLKEVANFLSL